MVVHVAMDSSVIIDDIRKLNLLTMVGKYCGNLMIKI